MCIEQGTVRVRAERMGRSGSFRSLYNRLNFLTLHDSHPGPKQPIYLVTRKVTMPHDGQCKCGEIKIHIASTHTVQDKCACASCRNVCEEAQVRFEL